MAKTTKKKTPQRGQGPRALAAGQLVSIATIDLVVDNHRQAMDPVKLDELAASMKETGLLGPIGTVKRGRRHVLIFGHRRLEAARKLGWKQIRCEVYTGLTDLQIAEMQAIENLQREDLTPIDEAHAVKALVDAGQAVELVASRIDRSADFVRSRLDLLRLDEKIHPFVASGRLPLKHARIIARIGDPKVQADVAGDAMGATYNTPLAKAAEGDYVLPLAGLRGEITHRMQTLGACYWPMDVEYARQRSCRGCPDNTATQPTLFDGIAMGGKSPKGNCTNKACFEAKVAAWERDPEKRRREKERAEKLKAQGKPPKVAKSDKTGRTFPKGPAEKYSVALWRYAKRLQAAMAKRAKTGGMLVTVTMVVEALHVAMTVKTLDAAYRPQLELANLRKHTYKPAVLLRHLGSSDSTRLGLPLFLASETIRNVGLSRWQPRLTYSEDKTVNVPPAKAFLTAIELLEALATRWGVKISKPRPQLADFEPKAKKAKKAKSTEGGNADTPARPKPAAADAGPAPAGTCRICGCTENRACPGGCSWVDETRTLCDNPDCVRAARGEYPDWPAIASGKKAMALKAIAACDNVEVLRILQASDLKGDWRRAAVATRIEELEKATAGRKGGK